MTIQEQRRIENGKVVDFQKKHSSIPYKKICADRAVWAVWIASVGNMTTVQTLILFGPTYFNRVLNYKILAVGVGDFDKHLSTPTDYEALKLFMRLDSFFRSSLQSQRCCSLL